MRKINWARLLLGGLLAGMVVNLLAWVAWILFLGRMEAEAGATHEGPSLLGAFIAGFVGVGLYVAIRPRFGLLLNDFTRRSKPDQILRYKLFSALGVIRPCRRILDRV
jgi:hypothetical protein